MTNQKLETENIEAYQALCSFGAWALYVNADRETLAGFANQAELFAQEPFTTVAPEAAATLAETFRRAQVDLDGVWQEIHRDRSWLFYMTGRSLTTPYESVYRTDDETLFGPTTLEVRAAYKARGLEFPMAASEPDDHCGLELSFIAALLGMAAEGDETALETARAFMSDHLLVFAPVYFANLQRRAMSDYFRAVGALCAATIEALAEELGAVATDEPKHDLLIR